MDDVTGKPEADKPNTAKVVSLDYLKEKMRERAETEVPRSAEGEQASSLTETLEKTKEAVEKVAEKLEELSEQVSEQSEPTNRERQPGKK
jgi:intein-encoded DNA endonuclease-like protein